MKETYTIPESERENVLKILARYQKKAMAYGTSLTVDAGEPYATKRNVYEECIDYTTGTFSHSKVGEQMIEVFDLSIEGEIIRNGNYSVVAKIEHLDGSNIVAAFSDEANPAWTKLKPHCDHCNGNHGQRITFIVRGEDGTEKQVGRTCLKDYCGIDPQGVGIAKQLSDLILGLDVERYDFDVRPVPTAYETARILALAIKVRKEQGYRSSGESRSNKDVMLGRAKETLTAKELAEGAALATEIDAVDDGAAMKNLLNNTQALVRGGYCKESHFGYLAYAPVAYERYVEWKRKNDEREASKNRERTSSDYIGEVGERVTVDVAEMNLLTSWENDYGYTFLYKIVDVLGNVLIWYSSKCVDPMKRLKASIKSHSERDGVKQTIVTRCTAVA